MDEGLLIRRRVCPVCNSEFTTPGVKSDAIKIRTSDSDFHIWYAGPSPDHYTVIVCSHCWYAAFAPDFGRASESERARSQRAHLSANCLPYLTPMICLSAATAVQLTSPGRSAFLSLSCRRTQLTGTLPMRTARHGFDRAGIGRLWFSRRTLRTHAAITARRVSRTALPKCRWTM